MDRLRAFNGSVSHAKFEVRLETRPRRVHNSLQLPQSEMSSTALITILDHLGGPRLTEADVKWIEDLPAGRSLLDFLASQIEFGTVGLRDIALEKEEAEM